MANLGTTKRIPTPSSPANSNTTHEPKAPHEKLYTNFSFYCPINIPMTSEAAAARIIRNIGNLGLYYTLFVWIILFISLIPQRKVSLILLVIMTYVTTVYCLLLRSWPNSFVLNKILDKRFVLTLIAIATTLEMIFTEAGIHLAVTLSCSMPIVLLHAVLWASCSYESCDEELASGMQEQASLIGNNNESDHEAQNSDAV